MATESQRVRVWEGWLGAEIRADYYGDLAGTYLARQRVATWLTLLSSSGAVATLLTRVSQTHDWLPAVLALLAAGLSLYAVVAQNVKTAVDSQDLHHRWSKLAADYRGLWDALNGADDTVDVSSGLAQLSEREAEASKSGTALPYSPRRLLKWQDLVTRTRATHVLAH